MKMKVLRGSRGEGSMIGAMRKCAKGTRGWTMKVEAKTLYKE